MATMLINGCSYASAWRPTDQEFGKELGFDDVVNLGLPGGSNERTFRTTTHYILENKVDFVVLMITFWARVESAWAESSTQSPIEGPWFSYSQADTLDAVHPQAGRNFAYDIDILKQYAKLKFICDFEGDSHCEKLFLDLVHMSSWLESKNIPYLIFGTCDKEYHELRLSPALKSEVIDNPRVINLFEWSSNEYLASCGHQGYKWDKNYDPKIKHYTPMEYRSLNSFLTKHILNNNLLALPKQINI
jgi:hypothetical protein